MSFREQIGLVVLVEPYVPLVLSSLTYGTRGAANKSNPSTIRIAQNNILRLILNENRGYRVKKLYEGLMFYQLKHFSTKQLLSL